MSICYLPWARLSPFVSLASVLLYLVLLLLSASAWAVGDGHAPWIGESLKGVACNGSDPKNYGPYDYVKSKDKLPIVEKYHFTPKVEQLVGGENAAGPTSDIEYVLTVIPNHHRALNSAMQFHFRQLREDHYSNKSARAQKEVPGSRMKTPVECYLQRAVNYSPVDAVSSMLYASFLHRKGKESLALPFYEAALELEPKSANINYNYALLLVDLERYEEAREIANTLYNDNFPLPGLKNKLESANQWP